MAAAGDAPPPAAAPPAPAGLLGDVAIIGGGYLGSRIAAWLLVLKQRVRLTDSDPAGARIRVHEHLREAYAPQFAAPCLPARDEAAARLTVHASNDPAGVAGVGWVIDCVPDTYPIKANVFRFAAQHARSDAFLTTNSMNLYPRDISTQAGLPPLRVMRCRFLAPVLFIPHIEVEPQAAPGKEDNDTVWYSEQHARLQRFLRDVLFAKPFNSKKRCRMMHGEVVERVQRGMLQRMAGGAGPQSGLRSDTCVVCMDRPPCVASLGECPHVCLCEPCAQQCIDRGWRPRHYIEVMQEQQHEPQFKCPLCRATVTPVVVEVGG